MPKDTTQQNFPDQAFVVSKTVASSLEQLDRVFLQRVNSIADIAASMMDTTINLVEKANHKGSAGNADVNELKEQLASAKLNATAANEASKKSTEKTLESVASTGGKSEEITTALEAEAAKALSDAYQNAVASQQQLDTIANAMLTQGIAIMFSLVPTAIGASDGSKKK